MAVTPAASQLPDVTGYDVEAADGHIGKVDEATDEPQSRRLVVDTGLWIFGKKRMIPAGGVQRIDPDGKKVFVGMTKDQIKMRRTTTSIVTQPTSAATTTKWATPTAPTPPPIEYFKQRLKPDTAG